MSLEENLAQARTDIADIMARATGCGLQLPAPPEQPDPRSCCGRGCHPCMFSYYFDALDRWRTRALAGLDRET